MSASKPPYATGNESVVEWLPPASDVIEPTNVQVRTPDLAPGRYGTPDGWLDVTEQSAPESPALCPTCRHWLDTNHGPRGCYECDCEVVGNAPSDQPCPGCGESLHGCIQDIGYCCGKCPPRHESSPPDESAVQCHRCKGWGDYDPCLQCVNTAGSTYSEQSS